MQASTLSVRSLWFPSIAEMRAWDNSVGKMYFQPMRGGWFRLGPRLSNLQAARFAPVLRAQLRGEEEGPTTLEGAVALPGTTRGLMWAWAALLGLWLTVEIVNLSTSIHGAGFLVWWFLLAAGSAAAVWLGWKKGGEALEDALSSLQSILEDEHIGDDDWGA